MSESSHTAPKQRVDAAPAGGDDRKGARRGAIFIGLVLVAYIVYLVLTGQILEFAQAMSSVQMSWIAVACLCMVLYFIFGVAAYAIAVWLDPDSPVGIRDLVSVEASGVFFGNLTPMMVGGTPAQIYRLTKAGQPVGEAGATQFTRYIVFQIGLVVWGAILLAVRLPFFTSLYGDMTLLCLFSFGGHVLLLTGLFIVCLCPRFVVRVAMWGIRFVERVSGESERTRGWRDYVNSEIYSFSDHFKHAAAHLSSMGLTMLVTMAQLAFFYMVPYFVLLAFGKHDVDFLSCLAAGAFIQLLSSAVPLPGGTGGAEEGSRSSWGTSSARPRRRATSCGASSRSSARRSSPRRSWACAPRTMRASMRAGTASCTAAASASGRHREARGGRLAMPPPGALPRRAAAAPDGRGSARPPAASPSRPSPSAAVANEPLGTGSIDSPRHWGPRTKSWTPGGVRTGGPHARERRGGAVPARQGGGDDDPGGRRARRRARGHGEEVGVGAAAARPGPGCYHGAPHPTRGGARERRGEGGPRGRDDGEPAAQGGVGRPKSGRLRPGVAVGRVTDRARREIARGDRPAPPRDHRFLEDLEELL